ncbi:MAG: NUDIX hydrolase [Syntrophales bacterium]|nr:NUDIX hydrolase [Syntrophales bacterium]MDD5533509.1 NUDIX hydrolase [Syntrophales bacterium]
MAPNHWELITTKIELVCRIFRLRSDRSKSPRTGRSYDFYVLEAVPWVNIIPITDMGEIVLIRQFRHGIRENTLEIPGGMVDEGYSPEEAAVKELLEETGYEARDIVPLGWVHPNPAILDNRCYTFLAKGAAPSGKQSLDEKEDIEVVLRPASEIPQMIARGEISHALVICALHKYLAMGSKAQGKGRKA